MARPEMTRHGTHSNMPHQATASSTGPMSTVPTKQGLESLFGTAAQPRRLASAPLSFQPPNATTIGIAARM